MPDWSYRTLFRPLLFALPARIGRDVALGVMGTLARSPLGGVVIDFLGHMRPPQQLACTAFGRRLVSPIGFGPELDPQSYALPALQRFGVGFVEVGPVGRHDRDDSLVRRDDDAQAIITRPGYTAIATDKAHALGRAGRRSALDPACGIAFRFRRSMGARCRRH